MIERKSGRLELRIILVAPEPWNWSVFRPLACDNLRNRNSLVYGVLDGFQPEHAIRKGEHRTVSGRQNIGIGRLAELVHDDSVPDFQPGCRGELVICNAADPDNDQIRGDGGPVVQHCAGHPPVAGCEAIKTRAGCQTHAVTSMKSPDGPSRLGTRYSLQDPIRHLDHGDLMPQLDADRGNFQADIARTYDQDAFGIGMSQRVAKPIGVVEGSKGEYACQALRYILRERPRPRPRRKDELVVTASATVGQLDLSPASVEAYDTFARMD